MAHVSTQLDRLLKERDKLKAANKVLSNTCERWHEDLRDARAKLEICREALEIFTACNDMAWVQDLRTMAATAREALEKTK